jgi:hypothetical protein
VKRPRNRRERREHLQRPPSVEPPPSRSQRVRQWLRRARRAPDIIKLSACGLGALGLMKIFELVAPSSPTGWFVAVIILGVPAMILMAIAGFLALRARFRMFGVH